MYCRQCGKEIGEDAAFCPYCGASQVPQAQPPQGGGYAKVPPVEESGVGWGILGFFIPVVGLILFLVWRDEHPARSKGAGIGALVSVCLGVVLSILAMVLFTVMFSVAAGAGSAALPAVLF